ncbi:LytR/AlgR family response regulator transcription factor [Zobellia laminariae]|uniref:LytR/AlgR family response regulator transcription factor n=1 Tax=Zobellia laminariae TaxID=248906 RepID=UPI0026F41D22|nr:LytTR family DNA-binding domain-containing protein [Zobellia laminariae]WKX77249.1 LytTR family DNA-binding domain-containing protein [Zobellia laminariae]
MIKAIALDDEPLALAVIETYSKTLADIHLAKTFTSQNDALSYLEANDIDLIFLDIEMPKSNGIEFCTGLNKNIKVVFTTAYGQYAVDGFNLNATDYLLKPYSLERFNLSIEKVRKEIELENKAKVQKTHLAIRADYKIHNIPLSDILFIEALDDYIKIHLCNQTKIVARHTMKGILKKLPSQEFQRIHRSYIVALQAIRTLGKDCIELKEHTLPLSPNFKENLLRNFNV